jgi:hypothetical protein
VTQLPEGSNFYSALHTDLSREQVAVLFGAAGWVVRKAGWHDYKVACPWAELVIEAESPTLLHGPVADVEANAEQALAILKRANVAFSAECYSPNGELLRQWAGSPA